VLQSRSQNLYLPHPLIVADPSPSSTITPLETATSFPAFTLTPGQIQYQTFQLADGTLLVGQEHMIRSLSGADLLINLTRFDLNPIGL